MANKKVALITGITGQDDAYLAEFLLKKGYQVHGLKRRSSLFNTDRIDHLYQDPHVDNRNFVLHYGDLTESTGLIWVIQSIQPDEIYNLAAQSHVAVSFESPDYVFLAAARVGGILANDSYPADFIYDNLVIETNIIEAAHTQQVKKLLFLGSTCIYPKLAPQPLKEEYLLTGPLEPTNEWYAVAKIAGIKLCQAYRRQHGSDFISAMPTNLYGPGDNYDLEKSHVIPAMLRKMHEAKQRGDAQVTLWGTGTPLREFLHVDDLADALLFLMEHYSGESHVNVGVGHDLTIRALAETVQDVVGFDGELVFDTSKPDGTPRKLVDTSLINEMGWQPKIALRDGLAAAYDWFVEHYAEARV